MLVLLDTVLEVRRSRRKRIASLDVLHNNSWRWNEIDTNTSRNASVALENQLRTHLRSLPMLK
jgi:hypothetical protein